MTTEDDTTKQEWTPITLYIHFTALLKAQEKLVVAHKESADKAAEKAEGAQQAHNVLANGLQSKLDLQAREFVTTSKELIARPEFHQRCLSLEQKIDVVTAAQREASGRSAGISSAWAVMLSVFSALGGGGIIGIVFLILKR